MSDETTFQEMYEIMKANGWERVEAPEYSELKKNRKHETARIGKYGFFKLKISNEEIKRSI